MWDLSGGSGRGHPSSQGVPRRVGRALLPAGGDACASQDPCTHFLLREVHVPMAFVSTDLCVRKYVEPFWEQRIWGCCPQDNYMTTKWQNYTTSFIWVAHWQLACEGTSLIGQGLPEATVWGHQPEGKRTRELLGERVLDCPDEVSQPGDGVSSGSENHKGLAAA